MENKTVKTMVESVMKNQAVACGKLAEVLANCGDCLGSGDLEAIANSVTMMAAARKNLELMAQAAKAKEGTAENPEVMGNGNS